MILTSNRKLKCARSDTGTGGVCVRGGGGGGSEKMGWVGVVAISNVRQRHQVKESNPALCGVGSGGGGGAKGGGVFESEGSGSLRCPNSDPVTDWECERSNCLRRPMVNLRLDFAPK